jgi:hypothetical protein
MNSARMFRRKVAYIGAIALLLLPIAALSQPAALSPGKSGSSPGGKLAQLRSQYNLAQAELGEIDPASETMKLSTLGLRGVAANILWGWANYYKKVEDWDRLEMTVNQIIRLQPNFVEVWDFQAHNLSYNVSVEFDDYRMRYQWVKKGIEFLILGTHYNRDEPGLLSQIGWFTGQKVGRADEQKQFRRLFRDDKDFHQVFRANGVEVDEGRGPDGKPDNWLVARLWYLKAEDAVTYSGKPIRGRTPLLFYSGAPMSQINGAAAMNKDGYFFETAEQAWRKAREGWNRYGQRELPTSAGFNIRLNDQEPIDERIRQARAELDRLCPGAAEEIRSEKRAKLSPAQLAALEVPPEKRSPEQYSLAYEAEDLLRVHPSDYLAKAPREHRPRVRQLVDQIEQDERTSHQIALNRRIVNFEYWRTRCESELREEAPQAHSNVFTADQLAGSGEKLTEARRLYEQAWKLYARLFADYPVLMENAEAQDLIESVARYRDLLGQLDEPFPADFPLWKLLDLHHKGQELRDQIKLLQGSETTPPAKADEPPAAPRDKPASSPAEPAATDPTNPPSAAPTSPNTTTDNAAHENTPSQKSSHEKPPNEKAPDEKASRAKESDEKASAERAADEKTSGENTTREQAARETAAGSQAAVP